MEHIESGILAFFRMELDTKNISTINCGNDSPSAEFDCRRDVISAVTDEMIAVSKIEAANLFGIDKERPRFRRMSVIPSEIGYPACPGDGRKRDHPSGHEPQTLMGTVFITVVSKKLHPEADSEQRTPILLYALTNGVSNSTLPERGNRRSKGSDTRQHKRVGPHYALGI